MVSNARLDLPGPDRPVKTINRSRGRSSETFFKLCSRAPLIVRVSAMVREAYRRSADLPQLPLQRTHLVAQARRVLKAKLCGRKAHLRLEGIDQPCQLLARQLAWILREWRPCVRGCTFASSTSAIRRAGVAGWQRR